MQETAAAVAEEGETQAMLFAMLQEQNEKQMETMAVANKANMDEIMEHKNVCVAASKGRRPNGKENTHPKGNNMPVGREIDDSKKPKCKKKLCPHCKLFLFPSSDKVY
jgi:hypothetical protein